MEREINNELGYCSEGLMYYEVIKQGMKQAPVSIQYGSRHFFHFPEELKNVIKNTNDMWRLHDIVFSGFRTFKGKLPKYVGPVLQKDHITYEKDSLAADIKFLSEEVVNPLNEVGAIYTSADSGFLVPSGLEGSNESEDQISDAEFLSEVVLSGFEVSDIEK